MKKNIYMKFMGPGRLTSISQENLRAKYFEKINILTTIDV